jgi:hypothetical protein
VSSIFRKAIPRPAVRPPRDWLIHAVQFLAGVSTNMHMDDDEMSPMPVGGGGRGLMVWCEGVVLDGCKAVAGMPLPAACSIVTIVLLLGAVSSGDVATVRTVAILLVLVAGLLGAFMPWWLRSSARMLARGNSLSAGVMLSAGLIHLLGDASRELAPASICVVNTSTGIATSESNEVYPLAMLLCSVGFVVTMAAEGVGHYWQRHGVTAAEPGSAPAAALPSLLLAGEHGGCLNRHIPAGPTLPKQAVCQSSRVYFVGWVQKQ